MEKKQTPAEQNVPVAGQEGANETPPVAPEPQPAPQGDSKDVEAALTLVDDYKKELESAQKKIRHLEKAGAGDGGSPEPSEELIALREEVSRLGTLLEKRVAVDGDNLAKLRTREAELRASLIARQTASNTSLGANQDKSKIEPALPALTRQQESLYTRIAQRHGMTLEEWRKQNKK